MGVKQRGIRTIGTSFDRGDPSMNDFLQRYPARAMNPGPRKRCSQLTAQDHPRVPEPGSGRSPIATELHWQSRGPGGQLAAAARRCLRAAGEVGGLIIDAKNDRAAL